MFEFNMTSNNLWNNATKPIEMPVSKHIFSSDGNKKRYFSSLDAEIYFNGEFVDDINTIGFQVQQNIMPLFGFNSYVYDELAVGSRMISGQFIINFSNSSHMINLLNSIINNNEEKQLQDLDLDKRKHAPVLDYGFNIILNYGKTKSYPNFTIGNTNLSISDVHITGFSQQLNISGEPIYEVYSFIAKDVIPVVIENKKSLNNNSNKNINHNNDNKNNLNNDNTSITTNFNITKLFYEKNSNNINLEFNSNIKIEEITILGKKGLNLRVISSTITNNKSAIFTFDNTVKNHLNNFIDEKNIKIIDMDFIYRYQSPINKNQLIETTNYGMTVK